MKEQIFGPIMIHDVGARDCSGRARKLLSAAMEGNIAYVREDFSGLMDNMFMIEKKMEVAVPLALGISARMCPLTTWATALALLDRLAHYSLHHDLDLILVALGARLEARDFSSALDLQCRAARHCASRLEAYAG